MKNKIVSLLLMCTVLFWSVGVESANWQEDFERLCGATEAVDSLTAEELNGLVAECDALLEVIDKQAGKQKKIYLFRLKKCRNFFQYMVKLKEAETKE